MAYSVQADIESAITAAKVLQLSDDNNDGAVDAGIITFVIAKADALIDLKCGSRYAVPFSTTPGIVNKISASLAAYYLAERRPETSGAMEEKRNWAMGLLDQISQGILSIPGISASSDAGSQVSTANVDPVFSVGQRDEDDNLLGHIPGIASSLEGSLDEW